jgi:hypothetical protein
LAALGTLALTRPAWGAGGEASPEQERQWYGAPIVAIDAAAFTLIVLGGVAFHPEDEYGEALRHAGVATYFAGGPLVHWARGHSRRGFASLGLRAGLPIGAALFAGGIGLGIDTASGSKTAETAAGAAAALGILAAPVLDAAVLAWEAPAASGVGSGWVFVAVPVVARDSAGAVARVEW